MFAAFHLQMSPEGALAFMYAFLPALPYMLCTAAALSIWLGISSIHLNQYEGNAIGMSAVFSGLVAITFYFFSIVIGLRLNLAVPIVFAAGFFILTALSRTVLLQVVVAIYRSNTARCRVLIYGAGATGMQLVSAFRSSHSQIDPVAFVDDNTALQGMQVSRLSVYSPVRISEIAREMNIDRILLAMPSLSQPKQAQIARRLQNMGLEVQTLPSFAQLIGEEALVDKLKTVSPTSFLNRTEVSDALGSSRSAYADKTVMITGAGGSIGSELCRQVFDCKPKRMVLFELSEFALYQVLQELSLMDDEDRVEVIPVLGSVTDARHVRKVLREHPVDVILHAAAYKHVPMVELNPLAGLANNVLGTHTLAEEAKRHNIERFILVSSDKAVRPTNVMGASKRLAELVIQDLASRVPQGTGPRYAIVRFGNVLGSSGSVVPLFQEQLRRGGPLTVTHPDVARFFMTVQEAVSLVLCAGSMAEGGEVFVLDMGKPVPILQLAKQVIESAGYTVRDSETPDGDIEIEFIGLREGEKMVEELTVNGSLVGTAHKKIFYTSEARLSEIEVASALRALRSALAAGDAETARAVVRRWVEPSDQGPASETAVLTPTLAAAGETTQSPLGRH